MPPPLLNCFSFLFILAFTLPSTSTCRFSFPGLILVPSAHTQSGWEWLQKLKNIALSGAEYLIAVMAVFLSFFVAILFRGPFPINAAKTFVGTFNAEMLAFP